MRAWSRGMPVALMMFASMALADETAGATATSSSASTSSGPCLATLRSPKLLTVSPAVLPPAVWERKPTVRVRVHFSVDASGHPVDIKAVMIGNEKDELKPDIEQAIGEAFARYRYCNVGDYAADAHWGANLLFSPGPKMDGVDGIYIQSFVPSYVGYERFGHHSGIVTVRGVYGTDGRATKVEVVASSGDRVIDDKTLDAMATAHLIFRNGVTPSKPINLERPFRFRE